LIAVKDWAKPPSDHVDPYHLGIRFVGFITANLLLRLDLSDILRRVDAGGDLPRHFCSLNREGKLNFSAATKFCCYTPELIDIKGYSVCELRGIFWSAKFGSLLI
jgi:hypothetical protein